MNNPYNIASNTLGYCSLKYQSFMSNKYGNILNNNDANNIKISFKPIIIYSKLLTVKYIPRITPFHLIIKILGLTNLYIVVMNFIQVKLIETSILDVKNIYMKLKITNLILNQANPLGHVHVVS